MIFGLVPIPRPPSLSRFYEKLLFKPPELPYEPPIPPDTFPDIPIPPPIPPELLNADYYF